MAERIPLRLNGVRLWLVAALVGALYFAAGRFGLALAFVHSSASPVWPPTGVAIAAVVLLGPRVWPAFFLGAFLFNWTAPPQNPVASLGIAAGNTGEALLGAWFTRRYCGGLDAFDRAPRTLRFAALVGIVATAVSATVGVASLAAFGSVAPGQLGPVWLTWWLGNMGGALVVAPVILLAARVQWPLVRPVRVLEALVHAGVAVAVTGLAFFGGWTYALFLLPVGLAWTVHRLGAPGISAALLGVAGTAVAATVRQQGPLWVGTENDSLLLTQLFLILASATGLVLATARHARAVATAPAEPAWRTGTVAGLAFLPLAFATIEAGIIGRYIYRSSVASTSELLAPWLVLLFGGALGLAMATLLYAYNATRRAANDIAAAMTADLRRSEQQLAEAQRIAHVGSWQWEVASDRVIWSEEMHRLFGVPLGSPNLTYETYLQLVHPDDREPMDRIVRSAMATGGPFEVEHRVLHPDGSERWILGRGNAELDAQGRPVRMSGTAQDVTDRKRQERERLEAQQKLSELEKLRELDRFKTRFIHSTAHELNTPLTPIKLEFHLLEQLVARDGNPDAKRSLNVVRRNLDRIESLVRDLLDSARIESGRLPLEARLADLDQIAREAAESYALAAEGARVAVALEGEPVRAVGDPRRISQIVHNLVSNAIKFSPRGARVTIATGRRDGQAFVRVSDTGPGLTPEQRTRLFQPFVRVHDGPSAPRPGTGLGLYISQSLAALQGGRIEVESDGANRGATFTLLLPEAADGNAPPAGGPRETI